MPIDRTFLVYLTIITRIMIFLIMLPKENTFMKTLGQKKRTKTYFYIRIIHMTVRVFFYRIRATGLSGFYFMARLLRIFFD